ncbi:DUF3040 domain-containing protein [Brevibacterium senegalense]|uniref:DUF3040 domain-containing protein n=1 Tax=Brevibacterium senegalense TaxID=1033736 RepID=UPI000318800A|nr:DUF3040 domain-containing protein [Brevibacterium senegalense]
MALSDHEQQLLDQLEKQLRDDPSFAKNISEEPQLGTGGGFSATRVVIGVVGVVVGLAIVLGAIWSGFWPLGILGFVVMVAGGFWAMSSTSNGSSAPGTPGGATGGGPSGPGRKPGSGGQRGPGFMDRMEDRWDKRRGGQ